MIYIYILYSENSDKYYVGHSNDPWRRLEQHNQNSAGKYTGKHSNWRLVAVFRVGEIRSEAMLLEKFIKQQKSRNLIKRLLEEDFVPKGKLAQLVRVPHLLD